jgi:hypothetical protein
VNKTHASLMVILGLLQIPNMFVNVLNEIAALARARLNGFRYRSRSDHPDSLSLRSKSMTASLCRVRQRSRG